MSERVIFAIPKGRILDEALPLMRAAGIEPEAAFFDKDSRALQKAVLAWTKKNYVWLHDYNPRVAVACLVDGMIYDAENQRLVKTYPIDGLRREVSHIYLELSPAPLDPNEH